MSPGVLFIFDGYPHLSGRFLVRDLDAVARAGLPVHAVTTMLLPRARWFREAADCPVEPRLMPRLRTLAAEARLLWAAPRTAWAAGRAFAAGLDWRNAHKLAQLLRVFWLAREARRLGVGVLHATHAALPAMLAQAASRVSGLPYTVGAHLDDVAQPSRGLEARLAGAATVFGCNPTAVAAARGRGARDVVEFRHPLPASWLDWPDAGRRAARPRSGPIRLLFAGRLVPVKGFDTLLAALARAVGNGADVVLEVAGGGEEEALVDRLPAEVRRRVILHGWVMDAAHDRLLDSADVLVLPSRAEGIPNTILEAFAAGLPVIATPSGSTGEALGGGERGFVLRGDVEAERVDALADLLERFDPRAEAVVARARAAQSWVRAHFSGAAPIAPMVERFRALAGD